MKNLQQILIWRNESNSKVKTRRYDDAFILQRAESYWNKNKPLIENKNSSSETNMPNKDE